MKKMKNGEIIFVVEAITAMKKREEERKEKLFADKINVSFAIKKNLDDLVKLIKPYLDSRSELLEECRTDSKDEKGNWIIRKDCQTKWIKGMEELNEIEIDVNVHCIKLSDLEGLSLSLADLDAIDFMIEESEF